MDSPPTVLVVEDEDTIRRFVRMALEAEGCRVFEAAGVQRGLIEAGTRSPDLLVVDLGLPDGDGVELIRDLRGWSEAPVIVLSARTAEAEKVAALDAGADDYLTKPFGAAELLARVRAHLRRRARSGADQASVCEFGGIRVDLARRSVTRHRQPRLRPDPPPAPARRVGPQPRRGQPQRARLPGPSEEEDRGRSFPPAAPAHRGRGGLPLRDVGCATRTVWLVRGHPVRVAHPTPGVGFPRPGWPAAAPAGRRCRRRGGGPGRRPGSPPAAPAS